MWASWHPWKEDELIMTEPKFARRFFAVEKDQWDTRNEGTICWLDGKWESEGYEIEYGMGGHAPSTAVSPGTGKMVYVDEFTITDVSRLFKEKLIQDHDMWNRISKNSKLKPIPVKIRKKYNDANEKEKTDILFQLLLKEEPYVLYDDIGEPLETKDIHERRCFTIGGGLTKDRSEMVLCEVKGFEEACRDHIGNMVAEAL